MDTKMLLKNLNPDIIKEVIAKGSQNKNKIKDNLGLKNNDNWIIFRDAVFNLYNRIVPNVDNVNDFYTAAATLFNGLGETEVKFIRDNPESIFDPTNSQQLKQVNENIIELFKDQKYSDFIIDNFKYFNFSSMLLFSENNGNKVNHDVTELFKDLDENQTKFVLENAENIAANFIGYDDVDIKQINRNIVELFKNLDENQAEFVLQNIKNLTKNTFRYVSSFINNENAVKQINENVVGLSKNLNENAIEFIGNNRFIQEIFQNPSYILDKNKMELINKNLAELFENLDKNAFSFIKDNARYIIPLIKYGDTGQSIKNIITAKNIDADIIKLWQIALTNKDDKEDFVRNFFTLIANKNEKSIGKEFVGLGSPNIINSALTQLSSLNSSSRQNFFETFPEIIAKFLMENNLLAQLIENFNSLKNYGELEQKIKQDKSENIDAYINKIAESLIENSLEYENPNQQEIEQIQKLNNIMKDLWFISNVGSGDIFNRISDKIVKKESETDNVIDFLNKTSKHINASEGSINFIESFSKLLNDYKIFHNLTVDIKKATNPNEIASVFEKTFENYKYNSSSATNINEFVNSFTKAIKNDDDIQKIAEAIAKTENETLDKTINFMFQVNKEKPTLRSRSLTTSLKNAITKSSNEKDVMKEFYDDLIKEREKLQSEQNKIIENEQTRQEKKLSDEASAKEEQQLEQDLIRKMGLNNLNPAAKIITSDFFKKYKDTLSSNFLFDFNNALEGDKYVDLSYAVANQLTDDEPSLFMITSNELDLPLTSFFLEMDNVFDYKKYKNVELFKETLNEINDLESDIFNFDFDIAEFIEKEENSKIDIFKVKHNELKITEILDTIDDDSFIETSNRMIEAGDSNKMLNFLNRTKNITPEKKEEIIQNRINIFREVKDAYQDLIKAMNRSDFDTAAEIIFENSKILQVTNSEKNAKDFIFTLKDTSINMLKQALEKQNEKAKNVNDNITSAINFLKEVEDKNGTNEPHVENIIEYLDELSVKNATIPEKPENKKQLSKKEKSEKTKELVKELIDDLTLIPNSLDYLDFLNKKSNKSYIISNPLKKTDMLSQKGKLENQIIRKYDEIIDSIVKNFQENYTDYLKDYKITKDKTTKFNKILDKLGANKNKVLYDLINKSNDETTKNIIAFFNNAISKNKQSNSKLNQFTEDLKKTLEASKIVEEINRAETQKRSDKPLPPPEVQTQPEQETRKRSDNINLPPLQEEQPIGTPPVKEISQGEQKFSDLIKNIENNNLEEASEIFIESFREINRYWEKLDSTKKEEFAVELNNSIKNTDKAQNFAYNMVAKLYDFDEEDENFEPDENFKNITTIFLQKVIGSKEFPNTIKFLQTLDQEKKLRIVLDKALDQNVVNIETYVATVAFIFKLDNKNRNLDYKPVIDMLNATDAKELDEYAKVFLEFSRANGVNSAEAANLILLKNSDFLEIGENIVSTSIATLKNKNNNQISDVDIDTILSLLKSSDSREKKLEIAKDADKLAAINNIQQPEIQKPEPQKKNLFVKKQNEELPKQEEKLEIMNTSQKLINDFRNIFEYSPIYDEDYNSAIDKIINDFKQNFDSFEDNMSDANIINLNEIAKEYKADIEQIIYDITKKSDTETIDKMSNFFEKIGKRIGTPNSSLTLFAKTLKKDNGDLDEIFKELKAENKSSDPNTLAFLFKNTARTFLEPAKKQSIAYSVITELPDITKTDINIISQYLDDTNLNKKQKLEILLRKDFMLFENIKKGEQFSGKRIVELISSNIKLSSWYIEQLSSDVANDIFFKSFNRSFRDNIVTANNAEEFKKYPKEFSDFFIANMVKPNKEFKKAIDKKEEEILKNKFQTPKEKEKEKEEIYELLNSINDLSNTETSYLRVTNVLFNSTEMLKKRSTSDKAKKFDKVLKKAYDNEENVHGLINYVTDQRRRINNLDKILDFLTTIENVDKNHKYITRFKKEFKSTLYEHRILQKMTEVLEEKNVTANDVAQVFSDYYNNYGSSKYPEAEDILTFDYKKYGGISFFDMLKTPGLSISEVGKKFNEALANVIEKIDKNELEKGKLEEAAEEIANKGQENPFMVDDFLKVFFGTLEIEPQPKENEPQPQTRESESNENNKKEPIILNNNYETLLKNIAKVKDKNIKNPKDIVKTIFNESINNLDDLNKNISTEYAQKVIKEFYKIEKNLNGPNQDQFPFYEKIARDMIDNYSLETAEKLYSFLQKISEEANNSPENLSEKEADFLLKDFKNAFLKRIDIVFRKKEKEIKQQRTVISNFFNYTGNDKKEIVHNFSQIKNLPAVIEEQKNIPELTKVLNASIFSIEENQEKVIEKLNNFGRFVAEDKLKSKKHIGKKNKNEYAENSVNYQAEKITILTSEQDLINSGQQNPDDTRVKENIKAEFVPENFRLHCKRGIGAETNMNSEITSDGKKRLTFTFTGNSVEGFEKGLFKDFEGFGFYFDVPLNSTIVNELSLVRQGLKVLAENIKGVELFDNEGKTINVSRCEKSFLQKKLGKHRKNNFEKFYDLIEKPRTLEIEKQEQQQKN